MRGNCHEGSTVLAQGLPAGVVGQGLNPGSLTHGLGSDPQAGLPGFPVRSYVQKPRGTSLGTKLYLMKKAGQGISLGTSSPIIIILSSNQLRLPPDLLGWFPTELAKGPSLSCVHDEGLAVL